MNVVGYEFDAVRKVGGGACTNNITAHSDCDTTSVPAWEQYNHHCQFLYKNEDSSLENDDCSLENDDLSFDK